MGFETPASLMNGGEIDATSGLDLATELHLMSFGCADDAGGAVYSGILTADEDGRDIWKDHPIDKAEGCTFVTTDFFFGVLTEEVRNCDLDFDGVCGPDVELLSENNAGSTCIGGTFDQQDANVVTVEDCEDGGGFFRPYSCQEVSNYLQYEADFDQATLNFLVNDWWKPKCCDGDFLENDSDENHICGLDMEFFSQNVAGASCQGGTLEQKDSNDGVTEEECKNGGGVYEPYSCEEANEYLKYDAVYSMDQSTMEILVNEWWKPKCCSDFTTESSLEDESSDVESLEVDSEPKAIVSAATPSFSNSTWLLLSAVSTVGVLSVVLWG